MKLENHSFRKKSSFFRDHGGQKVDLKLSPTSQYGQPYSGIEGYELKERITLKLMGKRAFYADPMKHFVMLLICTNSGRAILS
jgi:hypothetical protein